MTRGVCFSKVTEGVCHLETRETSEMSLESQPVPGWTTYPSPVIDSGFFFFFGRPKVSGLWIRKGSLQPC